MLGLHRCTGFALVVASRGCSRVVVDGLLISAASLAEQGLSGTPASVVAARGLSSCGSQTRAQAQWPWPRGSAALRHMGSSWIRDPAQVPCIGRKILYRWAAREVPTSVFLPKTCMLLFLDFSVLAIICCPSYSHSHPRTYVFLLPLWHQSNYINVLKYFVLNMLMISCFHFIYFFFFAYFFFYLWWILSYIEMKQPWVYMCSPSRSPLPPLSCFHFKMSYIVYS